MKMYKLSYGEITELEIISTTEKSVLWKNKKGHTFREMKVSSYQMWFETKLEAINYELNRLENAINRKETEISILQKKRDEIRKLLFSEEYKPCQPNT